MSASQNIIYDHPFNPTSASPVQNGSTTLIDLELDRTAFEYLQPQPPEGYVLIPQNDLDEYRKNRRLPPVIVPIDQSTSPSSSLQQSNNVTNNMINGLGKFHIGIVAETEYPLKPYSYGRYFPIFKDQPKFSDVPPQWFDDLDRDVVMQIEFEKKAELITAELRRVYRPWIHAAWVIEPWVFLILWITMIRRITRMVVDWARKDALLGVGYRLRMGVVNGRKEWIFVVLKQVYYYKAPQ
ncbi:hypothetical protein HDU76_001525 [Blyttiomyces sp. JEL0837]|nr:hypothetical protein HDU76_001525 [Blyttiomyces sp. JEL0837]